jgi:hypothetical protein
MMTMVTERSSKSRTALETLAEGVMQDEADGAVIDAEAKGDGRDDDADLAGAPAVVDARLFGVIEAGVVDSRLDLAVRRRSQRRGDRLGVLRRAQKQSPRVRSRSHFLREAVCAQSYRREGDIRGGPNAQMMPVSSG